MNNKILVTGALVVALALAGCSGKKNVKASAPPAEPIATEGTSPYDAGYGGTAQIGNSPSDAAVASERALSSNIVYFEYDSTAINADGESVVEKFAGYLQANPTARVRLEGHADERGTREYNVGLGERRAQSVEAALQAKGVNANQLSLLSYGEERPATPGHDEAAYAQNRRVQIIRQ